MKDKTITITPKGISQKQWSVFLLELNLMRKAWRPYGVNMEIKASGLQLVPVTKQMMEHMSLLVDEIDLFELCDILRLKLTTYHDYPVNAHVMNDGSGHFFGCIWR